MARICSCATSSPDEPRMGFRSARDSLVRLAPSERLDSRLNDRRIRELYGYCNRPFGAHDLWIQCLQI